MEFTIWFIAYIDPAAGGLLVQVVLGGTAGLLALFRGRIRALFTRQAPRTSLENDQ